MAIKVGAVELVDDIGPIIAENVYCLCLNHAVGFAGGGWRLDRELHVLDAPAGSSAGELRKVEVHHLGNP